MHDILKTFAILKPDLSAELRDVDETFFESLDTDFDGFRGHVLVSGFEFDENWDTWEMHPAGDELVILLSGATDFVLREGGEDHVQRVETPGTIVRVPRGVWHTARTDTPTRMLFVTPGEGTRNEPAPP